MDDYDRQLLRREADKRQMKDQRVMTMRDTPELCQHPWDLVDSHVHYSGGPEIRLEEEAKHTRYVHAHCLMCHSYAVSDSPLVYEFPVRWLQDKFAE